MRFSGTLFLLLLFASTCWANAIDDLKTDRDVALFLNKIGKHNYDKKNLEITILPADSLRKQIPCSQLFDQWSINSWEKADFNADGLTDMLVMPLWYGLNIYTVMDNGDGTFSMKLLSDSFVEAGCILAKPVKIDEQQLLLVWTTIREHGNDGRVTETQRTDTLIYKFGGFVELNEVPSSRKLKMITLTTSHCFGVCPVFSVDIYADGFARYMAVDHNPTTGDFEVQLPEETYEELAGLISYLDMLKLKDNYAVGWTDDQTAMLRVQFRDGTSKAIKDYGLKGTFGLQRLYELLFGLRLNQEWR